MSIQQLKSFLQRIDCDKPINLPIFISLLKKLPLFHELLPSDISARKVKGPLYHVDAINEKLNIELRKLTRDIGWDRVSSARQNRSHNKKVSGSILLIRDRSNHPQVVLFSEDGSFEAPQQQAEYALLIENRENYLSIDKTITFLKQKMMFNFDQPIDVIFAVGNEISNSLHRNFLGNYKKLYLFFDLDLGGLTITRNLNTLLPDIPKKFLLPVDIEARLSKVVEKQTSEMIDSVIEIGSTDTLLTPLAKLIKDYQRILEQESYLYDE